jgi:hypothetical protein
VFRLQALLRVLLEHFGAYAELGAAAAAEYRATCIRKLVLLAVALTAGFAGLAAAWLAGLAATWDTPWRVGYIMGSAAVLLVAAGISLYCALGRSRPGPSAGLLRSELRKDMELFQQWKASL